MAFSASPSLSSLSTLASPSFAAVAAAINYSTPPNGQNPLQFSSCLFPPLSKPQLLSCSAPQAPRAATGDGSGAGNRGDDSGRNSGKGGDGGGDEDDYEEAEFGPLLGFDEVLRLAVARRVVLPVDMMEAAKDAGIREILLLRYFDLQAAPWPLGAMLRAFSMLRNRMLADPSFLFKVGTEVVIDSCCATFAEVQKRGEDFWAEFELYAADLLVGVVVDIALVGLLAPYVRFGKASPSTGPFGRFNRMAGSLPSSVFEAERPGCRFTLQQRIGTFFYKGVLYGSVGFVCGIIGQGIANMLMTAKRYCLRFCAFDTSKICIISSNHPV
ncbi:hypothetical protein GUJ93_ZPchr0004g39877 [Zizania palustris]|uniref:Protein RETICULATA-RELATED 1, chloroplastic n=1 Tax=Zizania palustris TaxID=103762 RepID=A0A8J5VZ12_ZIZPA|nr:hypothetical protein GUJ93_ZPchr0004g39877 [Zizania palustris]